MNCSILIPTRGRVWGLNQAIASIFNTVSNANDIEVLIRIDADDAPTKAFLSQCPANFRVVEGERGKGYGDLHTYLNQLAGLASGDWLFPFTDDCKLLTAGWDDLLRKQPENVLAVGNYDGYNILNYDCLFVRRQVFDVLGRLSPIPAFDTHLSTVLFAISSIRIAPIVIAHNYQPDQTYLEGSHWKQMGDKIYTSEANLKERVKDINKLIKWKSK